MDTAAYTAGIRQAEEKLLLFLRTMERYQENLQFSLAAKQNEELEKTLGDMFHGLKIDLASLTPPEPRQEFHASFTKAVEHCADSYASFLTATGRDFAIRFLKGRFILCLAKHLLYSVRSELPVL